jgi:drug/metabolite transporter (DMT)-like permease
VTRARPAPLLVAAFAELHVSSGVVAMLVATVPIWMVALAHLRGLGRRSASATEVTCMEGGQPEVA